MRKDTVNMAITGLGVRGMMLLEELLTIPAVRIAAVCDIYEDRMRAGADRQRPAGQARPAVYTDYREMLAAGGLDGVVVACDWTAPYAGDAGRSEGGGSRRPGGGRRHQPV